MTHEIGTRIYYTGDMANQSDWGTLSEIKTGRFGTQVRIAMDNGPDKWVPPIAIGSVYNGTYNPRFVTEAAYNLWYNAQMAKWHRA